jgi:Ni,Fe-hydrogenase III small subunit/Pyruvate/2-oxoacid:ferredoxin oxidoreductase delta subunit
MLKVLRARWQQGYRTTGYPKGKPPELPERYIGRPKVDGARCAAGCVACVAVCPTAAIHSDPARRDLQLDLGRCIFCRSCEDVCESRAILFSREFRMADSSRKNLVISDTNGEPKIQLDGAIQKVLGRSLRLRQVSAGGCSACEADTNVLNTVGWDLGRFGIQFVASPRHADGLLITGPVTENMRAALVKTYDAVPSPKIVIAVGACAVSGGLFADHPETHSGASAIVPVDVFVPGCPPHPLTILDGLLRTVGRMA